MENTPAPQTPNLTENSIVLAAFKDSPERHLVIKKTRDAERRLLEAKDVNPITYTDLESCFNEGYRELRNILAVIGAELGKADKALEMAKSDFLIDKYQEIIKDLPKSQDSADLRKAHLMRDSEYILALDRVNQLKAFDALFDGKIKVFEKTCAFMKKRMDLITRSGLSNRDLYITTK